MRLCLRRLRLRLRRGWALSQSPARASRLLLVVILCATLVLSLAPVGVPRAVAQTDPATPTPTATATPPPGTDPQATTTPGLTPVAATDATPEAPLCAAPCLVSVAVSNSPVYIFASTDSARLAAFASGINLYALGMDATTLWMQVQIAPYTSGWIERSNLSEPQTLASLPVVATPVPRLITPTPSSLTLNAWVEYNNTDKSISIRIRGSGFRNNELVRFELINPSGRLVQKQTDKGNVFKDIFAVFILSKYTGGTYKIILTRDDGAVLEKTVTVKDP